MGTKRQNKKASITNCFSYSCSQSLKVSYNISISIITCNFKNVTLTLSKVKISFNLFWPNIPVLYTLKTSENLFFSDISWGIEHWANIGWIYVWEVFSMICKWLTNDIKYPWSANTNKKNAITFKKIEGN